ncbi:MAG: hypothetical protein ACI8ZX_001637, partial [Planctomycetota bacterium]
MFWRAFLISIIIVSSFGVFGFQKTSFIEQEDNLVHEIGKRNWVDSVTNTLTLEEKIGQFFMAAVYTNKDNAH